MWRAPGPLSVWPTGAISQALVGTRVDKNLLGHVIGERERERERISEEWAFFLSNFMGESVSICLASIQSRALQLLKFINIYIYIYIIKMPHFSISIL